MKIGEKVTLSNSQCESFECEYLGKGRYLVRNPTAFVGGSKVMAGGIQKIRKWVDGCP